MVDELFEKKLKFTSWCIEEYASKNNISGRSVANLFSETKTLDFLSNHYDVLHTQGKAYIIATIEDFINAGDGK